MRLWRQGKHSTATCAAEEACRRLGLQRRCVDVVLLSQGSLLVEHRRGCDENRRPQRNWESWEWRHRWTPSPHPGKQGESHLTTGPDAHMHTGTQAHSLATDKGSYPLISITSCPSKQRLSAATHLQSAHWTAVKSQILTVKTQRRELSSEAKRAEERKQ